MNKIPEIFVQPLRLCQLFMSYTMTVKVNSSRWW